MGGDRPGRRASPGLRVAPTDVLSGPVAVCVDRPLLSLDRPFTYELPEELEAGVGSLVQVPFHGKATRGWVLGPTEDVPLRMLKVRKRVSPVRFFDEPMLGLLRWMSERYVAPLATVIGRSHPPRVASEEEPAARELRLREWRGPPAAAAVGHLREYRKGDRLLEAIASGGGEFINRPAPEDEQAVAVEAVQACLAGRRTAIVIVPEASPVPATAEAVLDAFGDGACSFVGGDKRSRYRTWLDIQTGRYRVVVGTRPAVFAPLMDIGLIWISRESHPGHREERSPYYHVRDVARARAGLQGAVCVMSALCPSAEAYATGAPEVTPSGRAWPPVEVVRPARGGRSPRLGAALREAGRAFLYEPLPGYGVARVCRSCGAPAACANCGGVLRQEGQRIVCTVCEAEGRCAECGSRQFGVHRGGAERVAEWAAHVVSTRIRTGTPGAREGVTVGGPGDVKDTGPLALDLVAILDADLAHRRPGLASMERSLALWMEAVGWARPRGRAIVETARPGDPAVQALVAGNPERFFRNELPRREQAGFPAGFPVFRVAGSDTLRTEIERLGPISLLATGAGEQTVCLVTVRPDAVVSFGEAIRDLAGRGIVSRVEAEPHL